ncbi:MAG: hypothetical protein GY944_15785 [bacterium]|nr:hypothetical protein [bacterium]
MGGVSILVPPGVEIDSNGLGIMGGFSSPANTQDPDAPLIRVRGFALMGGVEVKVKKLPLSKRLLGG